MSLKLGIVGLPNVGKSTLFNALTRNNIPAENYPFCTIEPNVGVVAIVDERVDNLAAMNNSKKKIYATIEFVDIAGIVKGAAEGAGLGNKFLSNILEVDAIVQVVRVFENSDIIHVNNKIDPADDIETINTELILKDLEIIDKHLDRIRRESRVNSKLGEYLKFLEELKSWLEETKLARDYILTIQSDLDRLLQDETFAREYKQLQLLTLKPYLYVANVDDSNLDISIDDIRSQLKLGSQDNVFPLSIKLESDLANMDDADREVFMAEYGLSETGLNRLAKESYKLLNLISYLTTGEDETRAWTIIRGTNAKESARAIHSDISDRFISAEVIAYEDYISNNGYLGAKEKGKVRSESKTYIVQDGDIIEFRNN